MTKVTASREIKIRNRQSIYTYIRENPLASKQDISFGLRLSLPTVTQNIQYLVGQGLIEQSSTVVKTGGRNATTFACVENNKVAIGINIMAQQLSAVIVDLSGDILAVERRKIAYKRGDEDYLKALGDIVESVKKKGKLSDEMLLGVGISVPSLVSENGETVIYGYTINITGVTRAELSKYIPYPTVMCHDSAMSGYSEVWLNHELRSAFYISINQSVGGVFLSSRDIYTGNSDKAGEVGHLTVVPENGKQCYCGRYGCVDTVLQAGNLKDYADGSLEKYFELLKSGDAGAAKIWQYYLKILSLTIYNIRVLFDCDVIIGGDVGGYMEEFMEELYPLVDARNPFTETDWARDYVLPSKYKTEPTAAGAALQFINEYIESI